MYLFLLLWLQSYLFLWYVVENYRKREVPSTSIRLNITATSNLDHRLLIFSSNGSSTCEPGLHELWYYHQSQASILFGTGKTGNSPGEPALIARSLTTSWSNEWTRLQPALLLFNPVYRWASEVSKTLSGDVQ